MIEKTQGVGMKSQLLLVDRYRPEQRQKFQVVIDAGQLHKSDELELLEPTQLRPLAMLSLKMLVVGGIVFVVLNLAAFYWQQHTLQFSLSFWGVVLWLVCNIVSYILVLPLHELIHALAFLFWGGRPYFGAKLPLALYCGAKRQLFWRNHYLVVGLAPLVIITLAGLLFTLFSPVLASYVLFATVGNVAGAAGDVLVAVKLWRQDNRILVEDTEVGYRVWRIEEERPGASFH
ncbi:hypothetical protein KSF_055190 [Reticulibacter mediterranei]|uniref:DUF3267 domain-containing protein n=1 Tax=Reticulibacter mediterranei TaxID=2778369 RepID=A0A8J3IJ36_9CHLR|nr:DUF3267 domain-containing protein [Reticulibacter mediterranei]GHO95471.1 hypothetical protein KSF_055190 [Reticulibacter mediterranei]